MINYFDRSGLLPAAGLTRLPGGPELAYRVVLLKAGSPLDHEQWLDRDELLRLWPDLYLPRVVRAAWQVEHPVLARIGAGPQVPQLSRAAPTTPRVP